MATKDSETFRVRCHYCNGIIPDASMYVCLLNPPPNMFHLNCAIKMLQEKYPEQFDRIQKKLDAEEKKKALERIVKNDWRKSQDDSDKI